MAVCKADMVCLFQMFMVTCFSPALEALTMLVEHQTVTTNPSVALITLPCEYNTSSANSPRIDWYRFADQQHRGVMSVGIRNNITVHEGYYGRVARGNQASLILIGPSSRDGGTYLCKLKISGETPDWANGLVYLNVTNQTEGDANVSTEVTIHSCQSNSAALWILLLVDWIIPMCCVYGFSESYHGLQEKISMFSNIMLGLLFVVVVISTILITLSMKYITDCYSDSGSRWAVGISTGIVGDGLLIALVLWLSRLRKSHTSRPAKAEEDELVEKCPLGISLEDITSDNLPYAPTLAEAPDVIHCMLTTENNKNEMCVSTDHSVYLYDQSLGEFNEVKLSRAHNIFMIALCGEKLLISVRGRPINITRGSFISKRTPSSSITKNTVLIIDPKTLTHSSIKLDFSGMVTWIFVNSKGEWCATDAQKGYLRLLKKSGVKSETKKSIGKGFLQSPCCVVQNMSGEYIIADSEKNDVYIFEEDGSFVTSLKVKNSDTIVTEKMTSPFQLAIDSKDNLYVAEKESNTVYVFSSSYEVLCEVPFGTTEGTARLSAMTVNPRDGTLYVALGTTIKTVSLDALNLADPNQNDQSTC